MNPQKRVQMKWLKFSKRYIAWITFMWWEFFFKSTNSIYSQKATRVQKCCANNMQKTVQQKRICGCLQACVNARFCRHTPQGL